VTLQRQAEEIRQAELKRMHAKLGTMTEEQLAAVEALTRGLVNKFLHPPMQALKQAARENDPSRVEALCDAWSLPPVAESFVEKDENPLAPVEPAAPLKTDASERSRENVGSAVGGK
jgi:glutamyl-tRNA reductase